MNEKLIVTQVSADDEVYRVANNSHEDPSEHTYQVFLQDGEPIHCECPSWEYHEGECKHMQAVEDKLESRRHWRDWQVVQQEREEEERKQAMRERQKAMDELMRGDRREYKSWDALKDALDAELIRYSAPDESEQQELPDFDDEQEDEEESVGSELAKEMLAEAKETAKEEMMTEDEWREMSREGRRRAVAFF